jgi:hypothetical protein
MHTGQVERGQEGSGLDLIHHREDEGLRWRADQGTRVGKVERDWKIRGRSAALLPSP